MTEAPLAGDGSSGGRTTVVIGDDGAKHLRYWRSQLTAIPWVVFSHAMVHFPTLTDWTVVEDAG